MIAATVFAIAHYSVTTAQPLAQQRFDTALTELYAYDGPDAAVDFDGAALSDPHLAMAFWGKALAEGSDLNHPITEERFARAHADSVRASALETYTSADERQLIDAVVARYAGTYVDAQRDEAAYETAMRTYVASHPNDDDAAMLLVEALLESHGMNWNDNGTPTNPTSVEALELTQGVLARDPNHIFANHLCIHIYDTAPDRAYAIACAQRLDAMTFGPGEEHLAHMPAHLWIEIGDGEKAIASSERAWALHPTEYASHDAYVAFDAALLAGDRASALKWAARLAAVCPCHEAAAIDARFADWSDVLQLKPPQDDFAFADGLAAVHVGMLDRANADERVLLRTHEPLNAAVLGAELAEGRGNIADAIAQLQPFAQSLRSNGEMLPFFPPDETLGAIYYRANRFAEAQQIFSAILAARPDEPRALFGMWQKSLALNDATAADRYAALFHEYWAGGALTMRDF
jgi:tetratricopeptide (TPR) repeat protein